MDYKKAIEILKRNKPLSDQRLCGKELCTACDVAISAMQELQLYKDTGLTPDRLREIDKLYSEQAKELGEYRKLGTLEKVTEAMEKQTAISREIIEGKYFCPKCHNLMPYPGYCGCGQRLY